MAAKRGSGFGPSSPAATAMSHGSASYDTPARGASLHSRGTSPSSAHRHAGLQTTSPVAASSRSRSSGKPSSSPQPRSHHEENHVAPSWQLNDAEEYRELSLTNTSTECSLAVSRQAMREAALQQVSTVESEAAMTTNVLVKASELINGEVRLCEARLMAVFEKEREAREQSCSQLRRDVAEMVSFLEALSTQVQAGISSDNRLDERHLDMFLEQEKRARDALREDFESLADQVSALDDDKMKAVSVLTSEDNSKLAFLFEEERAARVSESTLLRQEVEALSTLTAQERCSRDLSIAVLRKDLTKSLKRLDTLTGEIQQSVKSPPLMLSPEVNIHEILKQQRADILEQQRIMVDTTCAQLRKQVEAVSVAVRSLPPADVALKCTGGTGNSEDEFGGTLVPLAEMQYQLQQRNDEATKLESLTQQMRSDLTTSVQAVNRRLEKVDQAINDLQFDIRSIQISELVPRRRSALSTLSNFVCGRG